MGRRGMWAGLVGLTLLAASRATTAATASPETTNAPTTTDVPATSGPADDELRAGIEAELTGAADGCEVLDPRHCFLPYPSNGLTAPDAATPTGRRVAFPPAGAPVNATGTALDVGEWNRNDGFSPNSTLLTYVEDLDAASSKLPSWTDLGASLAADAPVVLVDVDTGERVALWAELDAHATGDTDRLLMIHPAVALTEGHTYAVGLRGLVRRDGQPVEPSAIFRAVRDGAVTDVAAVEDRRPELETAFEALAGTGDRQDWLLAWDFTVASTDGLTARMLTLRDETLAALGNGAPAFTIDAVVDSPTRDDGSPLEGVARQVSGSFEVTNWLTADGAPGNGFHYDTDPVTDPDALPTPNGTLRAPFVCNIPPAVLNGTAPGRLVQYGHGLLGSHYEVNAGNIRRITHTYGLVYCATKWAGMSEDDVAVAAGALGDLSLFPAVVDRLQQGVLNQIVLSRLMTAPGGLVADPAFQRADGSLLVDPTTLAYDGNSQGAIMGLMFAGVSPDIERFALGVPGMNYGVLLARSVDFESFNEAIFRPAYPSELDQPLIIAMMQMLWDRGEGAGYAQHVTADPLPGTPAKTVLLHVALGDHQVSELTAFIEARTLGIPIHRPVTATGRSDEIDPGWGLEPVEYPATGSGPAGSAIIVWDSGAPLIPFDNLPPSAGEDPHGDPRADPDAQQQKYEFLFNDTLIDVCAAQPCTAAPDG